MDLDTGMEIINLVKALTEGLSVGFIASIPLGPIGVLCIQRTLSKGRLSGFVSGAGAASSDFLYALVAGFSISMVTDFVERHKMLLVFGGAIILIVLGVKMMRDKPHQKLRRQRDGKQRTLWQDYVSTFFLTISNPLALFVFMAAFSLMGVHASRPERLLVVGGVLLGALCWWLLLTFMVGLLRKKLTLRRLLYVNRTAGAMIVLLVIIAVISQIVEHFAA